MVQLIANYDFILKDMIYDTVILLMLVSHGLEIIEPTHIRFCLSKEYNFNPNVIKTSCPSK